MRRRIVTLTLIAAVVVAVAATLVHAFPAPPGDAGASSEGEHEQIVYHGVTACGVERWWIKTGIDASARSVNVKHVVPTSIYALRRLPAPAVLPLRSRIRPVETTVYRVSGYLLRSKMEADSDYHLVLSDSGGRTMIAEIPAPQCVGGNSPFLPQIRYVRRVFTARFHPGDTWVRGHWPVQVTGVGFFDFKHGQSGVAPNAIELHPVLSIHFGSSATSSSPPPPPATTPPASHGALKVSASVSPNPVAYGQYATLTAHTTPGASCTASVVYSTGYPPRSFDGSAKTVGGNGATSWSWHMESKGTGGTGTVNCSYRGQSGTAGASFAIG